MPGVRSSHMRVGRLAALGAWMCLIIPVTANAQVAFPVTTANASRSENFNTLPTSGTSSVVPQGFGFSETGGDLLYTAGNGSSATGDTYDFGSTGSSDRAFGELTTDSVQSTVLFALVNQTGAPIPHVAIGYTGEQWRQGATGTLDRLDAQYGVTPSNVSSPSWIDIDALDFESPNTVAGPGAVNGNAAANRTVIPPVWIDPAAGVPVNGRFWIRWLPANIAGEDDGLAIDDFTIYTIQSDGDGDGRPDTADNCPTTSNSNQADLDGDGQGDACDPDDDGDGVADTTDNCPLASNADQANTDGDAQGNICDADDDGDGLVDSSDDCPTQAGSVENHGCPGDPDTDGDGLAGPADNCPALANADQADLDGDGEGDICDADDDGDGVVDTSDRCPSEAGAIKEEGCAVATQPDATQPDATQPDTACADAKALLAKAKTKLRKLRQRNASKNVIAKAKRKVQKAKAAVRAACVT